MPTKAALAFYIGGMGARDRNFHMELMSRMGFEAEAHKIQDLFFEGRRDEAIPLVPDAVRRRDLARRLEGAHPRPARGVEGRARSRRSSSTATSRRCGRWPSSPPECRSVQGFDERRARAACSKRRATSVQSRTFQIAFT